MTTATETQGPRITTSPNYSWNSRKRYRDGWAAVLGEMSATAPTKGEAEAALLVKLSRLTEIVVKHRYIFTASGTVFIVRPVHEGFCYDIADKDRTVCCGCYSWPTFDEALTAAVAHIDGAFGGVVGQCS